MILENKPNLNDKYCEFKIVINNEIKPIPCLFIKANKPTNKIVIFNHGLNGSKDSLKLLHRSLDNAHILGYDLRAMGRNLNNGTLHYYQYVNDLNEFIKMIKIDLRYLNLNEFYICGESFGASISVMYFNKHQDEIDGLFIWNMPRKVIDVSESTKKEQLKMAFPLMWSLITNLPTYSTAPAPIEKLSNNRALILSTKVIKKNEINDNRNVLAAWLGNYKAWRILLSKKFLSRIHKKFIFITSNQDPLKDHKAVKLLDEKINLIKNKNIIHYDLKNGSHILMLDTVYEEFVLSALDEMLITNNDDENWITYQNDYLKKLEMRLDKNNSNL